METVKYAVFKDGRIGYVKDICTCDRCKERNMAELFINDLQDKYLDCLRLTDIDEIIYVGESLSDGVIDLVKYYQGIIDTKNKEHKYLQGILNLYSNQIISK